MPIATLVSSESRIREKRRHELLEAAVAIINEEGYARASVARISARANMSKSVAFYHYSNKEELLQAVIGSTYQDCMLQVMAQVNKAPTYCRKLQSYIQSNLRFIAKNSSRMAAVQQIGFGLYRHHQSLPDKSDLILEPLETMLGQGQASGEFEEFDVKMMAIAIRQSIDSGALYIAQQSQQNIERYIQELSDLFTRSCAK